MAGPPRATAVSAALARDGRLRVRRLRISGTRAPGRGKIDETALFVKSVDLAEVYGLAAALTRR